MIALLKTNKRIKNKFFRKFKKILLQQLIQIKKIIIIKL